MNPNREESACQYVLDQLEPAERAAFERQLLADPALAVLVHDLESALARGVGALPRRTPPAGLLDRIEGRLGTARPPGALGRVIARWGIAAAILLAVGLAGVWKGRGPAATGPYVLFAGLDPRQSTLARVPVAEAAPGPDARFVQLASLAQAYWDRPGEQPVKEGGAPGQGYAVFDPGTNQGFIAVRRIGAAPEGKRYHLWVIDTVSGRAREAGALPAAGDGGGLFFFSVAPNPGAKAEQLNFSVTAEDAAAVALAAPKGRVVLGATIF